MIHIQTIRNMVHLAIAVNNRINSYMLANLFPTILGDLQFQPVMVWTDEDSCMEFIEEHSKKIGVVLDKIEEPKTPTLASTMKEKLADALRPSSQSKEFDSVSRPSHYTEGRKYEPRKVIADWGLNFNLGNAVKYLSRAGRKGDKIEDLRKAIQYIEFEIEDLENKEEDS